MAAEPRYASQLYFDPDQHPEDTLKSFEEFTQVFELRYAAQYPDPPKVSMDSAIQRWKVANTTPENDSPTPSLAQYDQIRNEWQAKDKVAKLLGMFSSNRLYTDWNIAKPNEAERRTATWDEFIRTMREFYKPTENQTLTNYHFRQIVQREKETFPAFCNRVLKEVKHCSFNCHHNDCTAATVAARDQIVIGTNDNSIREAALKKSWDLDTLRREGMKMESAARGGAEISGEAINKLGKYSYSNIKTKRSPSNANHPDKRSCYNCGLGIPGSIIKHRESCPARDSECHSCHKIGHFSKVCRSSKHKPVQQVDIDSNVQPAQQNENDINTINLFRLQVSTKKPKPQIRSTVPVKHNFKAQVVINGFIDSVIADTGASVCVCGTVQAKKWKLLNNIQPSVKKLKPYNSPPIAVYGEARCALTHGMNSTPVIWHIISGSCKPVISGNVAVQLGIISFNPQPQVPQPINQIGTECKEQLQEIISRYPQNFGGLGKLKNHKVKLHVKENIKPVNESPRSFPYHLQERAQRVINDMISQDVIEEHPSNQPAPWVSSAVLAPKPDGSIRVTLDASKVNEAIESTNQPIPRQEDIKAKLAGKKIFSKLDFKHAFWQLELDEESRYLIVFHANNRLYRYKRLTMGLKPSQGELNAALAPLFRHIEDVHLIHDDVIIASHSDHEHTTAVEQVMEAISNSKLKLNFDKCFFGFKEITFWGSVYSADGVKPTPQKVEALQFVTAPRNKSEVTSFLAMMQSNSEFIKNFAQKAHVLRQLTKKDKHFVWNAEHQNCFDQLIQSFKQETLLNYFDMNLPTIIHVDAHISGLGATLSQGKTMETSQPISFASRTTNDSEAKYPQLDLEASAIDFALRRFRNYLVGSPHQIIIVTDHKPLCAIFNGRRKGSIRTERIKMRHQDINYEIVYRKGCENQADYISRHGKPFQDIPPEEQNESQDLNNLLFMLHTTPIMDKIGLQTIAQETAKDDILAEISKIVKKGQQWIPKDAHPELKRFEPLLSEFTISPKGILLKQERIILPTSLQNGAVQLTHRGSHPGIDSMERRLRFHFFFHHMRKKVEECLHSCTACYAFNDKKTSQPLKHHEVPSQCWDTVAVDLFGPLPSSNHVVVVQDLASRYPTAKLVRSTSAKHVLPALSDIYDHYGNPNRQISDNGPPFNSRAMAEFALKRDIQTQFIPPLHPQANPVETFMKPLGKTMKIANSNRSPEKEAVQQLLQNYRDTPHPATGVPPSAMLFRDNYKGVFPRPTVADESIQLARHKDAQQKAAQDASLNESKFRQPENFTVGDVVMMRNYRRASKFDPYFIPEPFDVIEVSGSNILMLVRRADGSLFRRHPDDVKKVNGLFPKPNNPMDKQPIEIETWHQQNEQYEDENDGDELIINEHPAPVELRRSERIGQRNRRYYNNDFEN